MKIIRIHNSKESKIIFKNIETQDVDLHEITWGAYKPCGLWYGINNQWHEWCKIRYPEMLKPYNYQIDINLENILIIDSEDKIIDLCKKYPSDHDVRQKKDGTSIFYDSWLVNNLNWQKLSNKYAGVEINPFLRLPCGPMWYEGMDCDSGCIWHESGLKSIKRLYE